VDLGSGRVCLRTLNHMFGLGLGLELGLGNIHSDLWSASQWTLVLE